MTVLGLECYTTGVEFTVIGRTRDQQVMTMLRNPRFVGDVISGRGETDPRFSVFAADQVVRLDPAWLPNRRAKLQAPGMDPGCR